MKTVNIQAAKTHLSRLLEEVAGGEEVILAKAGKPVARLIPFTPARAPRVGGQLKGKIWEVADCWDPDDDLLDLSSPLLPTIPASKKQRSPVKRTKNENSRRYAHSHLVA